MTKKEIQKIKRIRRLVALLIIIVLLVFLLWFFFRKKDFSIEYQINDFLIEETYHKNENTYLFTIKNENQEYHTLLTNVNFFSKKVISKIEKLETEGQTCLRITSSKTKMNPLCMKNNEQVSLYLTSDKMKENFTIPTEESNEDAYHQINIFSYQHHNYYIWNYRGFYHLNESNKEEMNLFSKDIYDAKLITKTSDYLWVPNYNEEFYFKSCYIINQKTGKQEVWNLKEPIYFDSVVLGVYEDEIYLVDKHEKIEWKLNPKKKTMEKIGSESKGGVTYNKGFIDVSMTKLMNQENSFKEIFPMDYEMNNGIYETFYEYKIKIRQANPTKIIQKNEEEVFYLVDNTLYSFNDTFGEIKLLDYFEWHFNNENVIFIF